MAYYRATGKRNLLDVAVKFADHIDQTFGPDKLLEVPGHEDLELALVKLYRDNANTLTPDPLHSAFHDSHPPAPVRIARLESG